MSTVSQAIDRYLVTRPQYADVLNVCGAIRALQKRVISRCTAPLPQPSEQTARRRLQSGQHILSGEHVAVDPELFEKLAAGLVDELPVEWALREQVECLLTSHAWQELNINELADCYAGDWEKCLDELALRTRVDHATVAYVLYTALGPFVERAAEPLRRHLSDETWNRGTCPVCGSPPIMAKLTLDGGQRILGCGFCRTEWSFPRAICPFCAESDPENLRQFHVEGDRGRRADVCETCKTYIKTADERVLRREVVLPVEDLVTVDLDLLARERGYE